MKFSMNLLSRFCSRLTTASLLVLPVGYGVLVAWQAWQFSDGLTRPLPAVASAIVETERAPLDATAVATVLGLATSDTLRASAELLTLQASFVVSSGLSKALLADAQGPRMYQVGQRLPGGSILRRVEAQQVVLWNKGREERLTLQPPGARFLHPVQSPIDAQPPVISARYLRPIVGLSE